MKNILINIVCRKDVEENALASLVEKCYSKNYKVHVNVCDYTLKKDSKNFNIVNVGQGKNFSVAFKEMDFEDLSGHDHRVVELIGKEPYDSVIDIDSSIELEDDFLDGLELDTILEDENYGCIYSDFYSKTKSGYKIHIHQKSFPLVNNSIPLVAFSVKSYQKYVSSKNIKGDILGGMVSKHIPKALCCISNA